MHPWSPFDPLLYAVQFLLRDSLVFVISSGSSDLVRGGARNMKSMRSPLAAIFLPPAICKGYVFYICLSFCSQGECMLGYTPSEQTDTPCEQADIPWEQTSPLGADPPRGIACWEIQSTSGWYASHWNAILLPATLWQRLCFYTCV